MSKELFDNLKSTIDDTISFFQSQQRVIDLWSYDTDGKKIDSELTNKTIEKFFIDKNNSIHLVSLSDVENMLALIKSQSRGLCNNIAEILDSNESQLSDDLVEALEIIFGQVQKFRQDFDKYDSRFRKAYLENTDLTEAKKLDQFSDVLRKLYANLFDDTISAIYRGMDISSNPIYDIVLSEINAFFKNTGIYTLATNIGDKIDFDFCVYADNEITKETENSEMDDCIYDIRQYPYMIDGILLSPGKVLTWRFAK